MLYLLSMLYGIGMCSAKHFVRREVAEVVMEVVIRTRRLEILPLLGTLQSIPWGRVRALIIMTNGVCYQVKCKCTPCN